MAGPVQAVERAAAMLQLLATEEDLGLAEIAGALHLPKTTAHGLLRTLVDVGFAEQVAESGRYRISADLFRLGSPRLDLNELRSRAINWADALASRTGESARLAAFRSGEPILAHVVRRADTGRGQAFDRTPDGVPPAGQAYPAVGSSVSLHANALGKILLAHDPGAARSLRYTELPALTHRTVVESAAVQRGLAHVRERGVATAVDEERVGVCGIAAPIRDRGGYVVAAIGVEGATGQLCDGALRPRTELVEEVQRAASAVSRELGHGRAG